MIKSTNLRLLLNLEFFQIVSNILAYLKSEKLDELKLTALVEELEAKFALLDKVLVSARGNVLSATLQGLDKARDVALRSLYGILKIYLSFPEEEKASAALHLLKLIDKHGKDIDKMSYSQESGALVNIFQEFALEANAGYIALLHVEDWVEKLKAAQSEFNELFIGRESENAVKLTGEARQARIDVQDSLDKLGKTINAYEIVYGAEAYALLVDKINEAVSAAKYQVARRGPHKAKSDSSSVDE